jgi:PD-(D/E)XK nuclease superfamily
MSELAIADEANLPYFHLPQYVDSNMLVMWRACRRKYFWAIANRLYPTGKSIHLAAGAAIAAGLEAIRRHVFTVANPEVITLEEMLYIGFEPFRHEWGYWLEPEEAYKSFSNTWSALKSYLQEFDPRHDVVQPYRRPDGTPAIEYTFAIPTGVPHPNGGEFLFVGRFDLLGLYNTLPCVLDEKTSGSLGMNWADQWDLRGQFMGYCWALQQQGLPTADAIVRGIAIQKTQYVSKTVMVHFSRYMLDRWHRQLIRDLEAMSAAYTEFLSGEPTQIRAEDFYPYNFADACSSYGGCAYNILCRSAHPERFFTNYSNYVWDPLAKQPLKESDNELTSIAPAS